jgi:hypothetical protein
MIIIYGLLVRNHHVHANFFNPAYTASLSPSEIRDILPRLHLLSHLIRRKNAKSQSTCLVCGREFVKLTIGIWQPHRGRTF